MDIRRFIFGIVWFIVFINLYYILAGTALGMKLFGADPRAIDPEAIRAALETFIQKYGNLSLLGPYVFAVVGTLTGFLPGTRRIQIEPLSTPTDQKPNYPTADQALGLLLIVIILQVGVTIGTGAFVEIAGKSLAIDFASLAGWIPVLASGGALFYALRVSRKPLTFFMEKRPIPPALPISGLMLIAGVHILGSEADNLLKLWFPLGETASPPSGSILDAGILAWVAVIVLGPLVEEILFRGVMVGGLSRSFTFGRAVVLPAFFFAFTHLDPYHLLPTFAVGIVLGWIFYYSRNIWLCFALNAISGVAALIMGVASISIPGFTPNSVHSLQPVWFDTLGLFLLVTGAWWTARLLNDLQPVEPPPTIPQRQ